MALRIEIVRERDTGRVVFEPSPVAVPGEQIVFWCNLDSLAAHHISVCPNRVAQFRGDPPGADCTDEFLVQANQDYECLLHPEEKGWIKVTL